jgi:hypothetical protein
MIKGRTVEDAFGSRLSTFGHDRAMKPLCITIELSSRIREAEEGSAFVSL